MKDVVLERMMDHLRPETWLGVNLGMEGPMVIVQQREQRMELHTIKSKVAEKQIVQSIIESILGWV